MKLSYCLPACLALASLQFSVSEAAALTPEDFCDVTASAPKGVKEMRPMADGVSYCAISDDGRSIEVYSYKTGKKVSVLFSLDNIKGNVKITDFDGYQLSANEKKILLWNDSEQIYRHSFTARYYVYDVMRSTLSEVSQRGPQRGAVLSHDGRMVAYTFENNIYVANLDYKTDVAVTKDGGVNSIINGVPDWGYEEEFGVVNTIRWSPDDTMLAFVRFDESQVPTYSFDAYKSYCSDRDSKDYYPSAYTYKYPLAGCNNSVVSVHSYNLDTRVVKKMDLPIGETDYVPSLEFDGAGKNLMVMLLNRDQNDLQLFRVNPGSTVARSILRESSDAWLSPAAYQMVHYGATSFVIGSERSGWRHLYEYDYNGTLKRQVTKGEFNVTAYYGRGVNGLDYVQTTSGGAINRTVESVDRQGRMVKLSPAEGFGSAAFSSNFSYFLLTYSNASTPTQYTICNAKGGKVVDVELNAEYAAKYASAPKMEFLKVPNADGQDMNAFIIRPSDFDSSRKYPLLMYQYNGPDSQEVLNRWRMEGIFYLASQGYVVACVDGRGTGNRDRQWSTAVYRRLGQLEVRDQLAGARYFSSLPYVDDARTACFGWSYGGYMTLMELSDPECRFKAGVAMAPVVDWRLYDSIYTERYMLTPQQNVSGYDNGSALMRTDRMNASLLIMSGTNDDNVHYDNTLRYTSKLTDEGKLFDMMSFTGWEHSLRMCNARTMLFRRVAKYLDGALGK